MSGRVAAVEAAESDPDILYVGAATGGVWKSVNGGLTWKPLFDDQPVAAIGALALDPSNPNVVWVGTGEGNPRNSVSVGNGVYRTLDGGRTWTHLGLEKTERIHRIVLHPSNPEHRLGGGPRAALGREPRARRLQDGRRRQDLAQGALRRRADRRGGPGDRPDQSQQAVRGDVGLPPLALVLPLGRPGLRPLRHLRRRRDLEAPHARTTACPRGTSAASALAISRSNPSIVYALVEAEKSALLRSDDGGRTWKTVNDGPADARSGPSTTRTSGSTRRGRTGSTT